MIIGLLAADYLLNNWDASVFLGKKFVKLSDWLMFWR
ncbi:MAG: glyceraldehyde-3-phosphate dehydrogenase [Paracoccaceae bacterium]